jgi:hypothetical protein
MGGVSSLLQLTLVILSAIIAIIVGSEPKTAVEYFTVLGNDGLAGLLRLDFATLLLLCLFPFTGFGILAALRRNNLPYAALAVALVFVGTILGLANHSAFSMIRLSELYAEAASAARQDQLLAVGEAMIASDMWNGTAGILAGLFMQGGFVFISFVMLRSRKFSKGTAITGMLANGLDWIHVPLLFIAPALSIVLLYIAGVFYLAWFPLLGRDLLKLGND